MCYKLLTAIYNSQNLKTMKYLFIYHKDTNTFHLPKWLVIILIKRLILKAKYITINNNGNHTNMVLNELKYIQYKLFYYKSLLSPYGVYHKSCGWSDEKQKELNSLFSEKDYEPIDIVLWYHPEAVTYYRNRIYYLENNDRRKKLSLIDQLKQWNNYY